MESPRRTCQSRLVHACRCRPILSTIAHPIAGLHAQSARVLPGRWSERSRQGNPSSGRPFDRPNQSRVVRPGSDRSQTAGHQTHEAEMGHPRRGCRCRHASPKTAHRMYGCRIRLIAGEPAAMDHQFRHPGGEPLVLESKTLDLFHPTRSHPAHLRLGRAPAAYHHPLLRHGMRCWRAGRRRCRSGWRPEPSCSGAQPCCHRTSAHPSPRYGRAGTPASIPPLPGEHPPGPGARKLAGPAYRATVPI